MTNKWLLWLAHFSVHMYIKYIERYISSDKSRDNEDFIVTLALLFIHNKNRNSLVVVIARRGRYVVIRVQKIDFIY